VSPRREFDPKNKTFGAFEIAGRYHQLKIDGDAFPIFANPQDSSRKAEAWALGLNWYFNRNVKFALNYERTDFTGGAARGDRPAEKAVLSRFQIAF
jgi:phosphate-selective porin OprO/OprP